MPSTDTPLAQFDKVTKTFGKKEAVKEFSFEIRRGEIVGLLGPNGAGKSTSMKMLTGYISASKGYVYVNGENISKNPENAQQQTGYLPESTPLYAEWTVKEFLKFSAHSRGLDDVGKAVDRAIERSGLAEVSKQLIGTLSKGYRQRTCFAQSIIHDPPLLILDEATDGLDPNQKKSMQRFIKNMGKDKGIFFSTHILSEAEAVCDRVLVLNKGTLVHNGDVASLRDRCTTQNQIRATVSGVDPVQFQHYMHQIEGIKSIDILSTEANMVTALITQNIITDKKCPALSLNVARCFIEQGWPIIELKQETSSLDDAFAFVTQS